MTTVFPSVAARRLLGVSAAFLLGAVAAHAESYQGVHPATGALSRAEVQQQGHAAARDPMWNVPSASRVVPSPAHPVERAQVRAEAVQAAAGNRSGELYPSDLAAAPTRAARAGQASAL